MDNGVKHTDCHPYHGEQCNMRGGMEFDGSDLFADKKPEPDWELLKRNSEQKREIARLRRWRFDIWSYLIGYIIGFGGLTWLVELVARYVQ